MDRLVFATGPAGERACGARRLLEEFLGPPLQMEVSVVSVGSYGPLLEVLEQEEAQLAWLPPALLVEGRERGAVVPLLVSHRGSDTEYRSVLFVPAGSEVREVSGVRGARVGWVDPASCSGYLFPRLALIRRGIDPDELFGEERMLGSHEAVARAVADGEVDVGATWLHAAPSASSDTPVQAGWIGPVGADRMRAILTTPPIPGDCIAAASSVDEELRTRVAYALRHLPGSSRGRQVLETLFGASRFRPFRDEGYRVVQQALRGARSRGNRPPDR